MPDDTGTFASAPAAPEPASEPAPGIGNRRRWLTGSADDDLLPESKPTRRAGGTLFERMASASRGAKPAAADEDKDPLDIPRFLRSQNNQ